MIVNSLTTILIICIIVAVFMMMFKGYNQKTVEGFVVEPLHSQYYHTHGTPYEYVVTQSDPIIHNVTNNDVQSVVANKHKNEVVVQNIPTASTMPRLLLQKQANPIQTTHSVVAGGDTNMVHYDHNNDGNIDHTHMVTNPSVQLVNFDKNLRLDDDGNTWVLNNLGVDGNQKVKGTFEVDSKAKFKDYVGLDGSVEVAGPANFKSLAEFNGGINVANLGRFKNDLEVIGHLKGKNNLTVDHNAKVGGSLEVDNIARFNNVVDVKGDIYTHKDMKVFGDTRLEKGLHVGGPSTVHNRLTVDGIGTFKHNLGIVGDTRTNANLYVGNNADVGKNTNIKGHLRVHGGVGSGYEQNKEVFMVDNSWGDIVESKCPHNHFLCGIKARYEKHNSRHKDRMWDTGVNGLWLKCCPFN